MGRIISVAMAAPTAPLINANIGDLAKPLTKLIAVTAAGCGKLYEGRHIRNVAKAQAEAAVIAAEGEVAANAIRQRAAVRLEYVEERRQQNIESIATKAQKYLPDVVSDEPVDPDWAFHFFEEAKDTSNEEVQELWAKILASETAKPGSCSRRTLSIIKQMERRDAVAFAKLGQVAIEVRGSMYAVHAVEGFLAPPLISSLEEHELRHLGLVRENAPGSFIWGMGEPWVYQGGTVQVRLDYTNKPGAKSLVHTQVYPFSVAGEEIARACGLRMDRVRLDAIRDLLKGAYTFEDLPS